MNKKYISVFDKIEIVAATHSQSNDKFLSQASLDSLKKINLPEEVDLNNNPDLLGVYCNAAVINRLNRNGDGIDVSVARAIQKSFINKPSNIEHNTSRVVGHTIKVGWSEFGSDELLEDEDLSEDKPFNLVLGGVVYRRVDPKFASLVLDSTDPSSKYYRKVSASWEVGFDNYVIVRAPKDNPNTRNIFEMERIEDEKSIAELKKYLLSEGGSGVDREGRVVGKLIVGDEKEIIPYGIGYTSNPAAEVEGVVVQETMTEEEVQEEAEEKLENISQNSKTNVNPNNNIVNMNIKSQDQLLDLLPEESKASAAQFIAEQIEKRAAEFEVESQTKASELEKAQSEAADLKEKLETAESSIEALKSSVKELQSQAAQKEAEAAFQERMSGLQEEFVLESKDLEIVAKRIKGLDDESYQEFYEEFSVLASAKNRKAIEAAKEEEEAKKIKAEKEAEEKKEEEEAKKAKAKDYKKAGDAKASETDQAEALLDSQVKAEESFANASDLEGKKDFISKWSESFADSIEVNGEKIKI